MSPLRILHVMRAPVGGLFRHVADLAAAQAARGHQVGIVADSTTGAARAEAMLFSLAPEMALGITRIPMSRHLGWGDIAAQQLVTVLADTHRVDVIHGHGAKGGAYARLTRRGEAIRVYTPHGGSLHYGPRSALGLIYLTLERVLMRRTDLFLFESAYGRHVFEQRIGKPRALVRVVHNGVTSAEFEPIAPDADATDLLFVGELRMLKGIDVLLNALALLAAQGQKLSLTVVGDGPDAHTLRERATDLGLGPLVRFAGVLPARTAFAKGRTLVVPSRAESLPYIVLEAAAAGIPIVATGVGGIGEIFGEDASVLIPPGDAPALATAIATQLARPDLANGLQRRLQARVNAHFSVVAMTDQVLAGYAEALQRR